MGSMFDIILKDSLPAGILAIEYKTKKSKQVSKKLSIIGRVPLISNCITCEGFPLNCVDHRPEFLLRPARWRTLLLSVQESPRIKPERDFYTSGRNEA